MNVLLFLSQPPFEYLAAEIIRKSRQEGAHLVAELRRAHFVGQCQRRAIRRPKVDSSPAEMTASVANTRHLAAHWASGHWRQVACGPKSALRRLQFISAYRTGSSEDEYG
jgi:hypothetical protein